jgi:hypothetical protein
MIRVARSRAVSRKGDRDDYRRAATGLALIGQDRASCAYSSAKVEHRAAQNRDRRRAPGSVSRCTSATTSLLPENQIEARNSSERTQWWRRRRGSRTCPLPGETQRVGRSSEYVCRQGSAVPLHPDGDTRSNAQARGAPTGGRRGCRVVDGVSCVTRTTTPFSG